MKSFTLTFQWNPEKSYTPKVSTTIEEDDLVALFSKLLLQVAVVQNKITEELKANRPSRFDDDIPF